MIRCGVQICGFQQQRGGRKGEAMHSFRADSVSKTSAHPLCTSPASIKIMYEPQPTPRVIEALLSTTVKSIGCGHTHTLAVDAAGATYSWGNGNYGKLGHKVLFSADM